VVIVRVAVNAVALLLAALLVPDIEIDWAEDAGGIGLTLLALAVVFGVVNASLRPIARLVAIPLNIVTLGLFSVVLNALLLLAVAFLVDLVTDPLIIIGGYPPDLGIPAVAAAMTGAFVIGAISTALRLLIPEG
jgi:putative membrane protein